MCHVNEFCGLAKKLKREQNAALVEKTNQNGIKKQLERKAKAGTELIERSLGFRPDDRGVMLIKII